VAVKQIQVSANAQGCPAVNISDVALWSPDGDEAQWLGTGPYEVYFPDESPFSNSSFNCPSGSSAPLNSGPLKVGATGVYKYNVRIGTQVLDPKITVHP